jgi:hypothetical protein
LSSLGKTAIIKKIGGPLKRIDGIFIATKELMQDPVIRRRGGISIGVILFIALIGAFISYNHVNATISVVNKETTKNGGEVVYGVNEIPKFLINTDNFVQENEVKHETKTFKADSGEIKALVKHDNNGQTSEIDSIIESQGNKNKNQFFVTPPLNKDSAPGKYTLRVELTNDGKSHTVTQDFQWGVLAINFNQSTYKVNEKAIIGMAVLDDNGHTLCDSNLTLEITDPQAKSTVLSTDEKSIIVSDTCIDKNVTNKPDYAATYEPKHDGKYTVKLTAETKNGKREIVEQFNVQPNADFVVQRNDTAMRIYPPSNYTVKTKIIPQKDVDGIVRESVPASFKLNNVTPKATIVQKDSNTQIIEWPVLLKHGNALDLTYTYKAPDVSPAFYVLGPLEISQRALFVEGDGAVGQESLYTEPRAWQIASDAVANNGLFDYASTANTGMNYVRTYTQSTNTANAEYTDTDTSANDIYFMRSAASPTREEVMVAHQNSNIELNVLTCTTACDAGADWTLRGTKGAMSGATFTRAFDIAYEQLSGRAMVVWSDAVSDAYYCLWDGSSWTPSGCNSAGTFANTVNNKITLSSSTRWIKLKAQGDRNVANRSNQMLLVAGGSSGAAVARWDGSTWTDITNLTANALAGDSALDVAWESVSGNAIVVWDHTALDGIFYYRKYTVGSGWDGADTQIADTGSGNNAWIELASDPMSDRISLATNDTESDANIYMWKSNGTTAGFTAPSGGNPIDASIESNGVSKGITTVWSRFNSRALFAFTNSNLLTTDGLCWSGEVFGSVTANFGLSNNGDDVDVLQSFGSPNSAEAIILRKDIAEDVEALKWNGAGCATSDFTAVTANGNANNTLTLTTTVGDNLQYVPATFTYFNYSPWTRNWRIYSDVSANDPSTGLAAENVAPTGLAQESFIRMRFQMRELGSQSQTDTRKKLQYTSGCTPNTSGGEAACTWADVGDTSETSAVWRYATSGESCASCTDNTAIATARLTGTDQTGNGFYTTDKDAAAGANMDHTALKIAEIDYPLKAEAVAPSTTYYFRMFDLDQLTPVYRRQDSGTTDCLSAACAYPSIATAGPTISGIIYTGEGSGIYNCATNALTVALRVNGGSSSTNNCTTSGGTYSITNVTASAGSVITVYLDNETENATAVTRMSNPPNNITLDLYQNRIIVRDEDGTALSNTNMDQWDSGNETDGVDGDIGFTVTSGALTVSNTRELHVWTGKTFTPGGTVATNSTGTQSGVPGDIHIDTSSTLSMGTNALSVGGDYTNAGTFSKSTGQTTTFTATGANFTITPGTGNFDSVTFNGSGGDWTPQAATTLDVDLTMTAGTLKGTQNITVKGAVAGTAGIINLTGGTFNQSVAANQNFGTTSGTAVWTFSTLQFSQTTGTPTITAQGGTGVINATNLTISASTTFSAASRTYNITGSGTPVTISGSFTASSSTVSYEGTSATTVKSATYNNLQFNPPSGTPTYTFESAAVTTNADLTLTGAGTPTVTAATNDPTLDINGSVAINKGTLIASDLSSFNIAGNWTLCSTCIFTHSSGTVGFDTTATATFTGATTFNNFVSVTSGKTLQFQKHTAGAPVITFAGTFLVLGSAGGPGNLVNIYSDTPGTQWKAHFNSAQTGVSYANIRDAGCDAGTSTVDLSDGNSVNVSNNDTSCWLFPASGISVEGVVYMANESTLGTTGNSGPCDGSTTVVSVRVNNGTAATGSCNASTAAFNITTASSPSAGDTITVYLTSSMKANTVYVSDANADIGIDLYQNTLAVGHKNAGPATILDLVDYDSTTNNTDMLYDAVDATPDTLVTEDGVELHIRSSETFAPGGTVTTDVSNDGTNTVKDGDVHIVGTLTMGTNALSIGGDLNITGTFNKTNTQTTTFTATATGHEITTTNDTFNNITFNGVGGGWTLQDTSTIDGVLTITNGNFSGGSVTLTLSGSGTPFVNNGVFTPATSTVNYTGTSATALGIAPYNNLGVGTTSDGNAVTYTLGGNTSVNTVLTVGHASSSATDTLAGSSYTLTLNGGSTPLSITANGTFSAGTSTVVYAGDGSNVTQATYNQLKVGSTSTTSRSSVATFASGENFATASVLDEPRGYAYYSTNTSPAKVVKVRLSDFTEVAAITFPAGENFNDQAAVIDQPNGYAYFGTSTAPGKVVKVDIDPNRTFERIGAVTFNSGETGPTGGVIDVANQFAYFGTSETPAKVVKIALGSGSNPPTRVTAIPFSSGENNAQAAVIDTTNGYAYFSANVSPGKVVKVDIDPGRTFQRIGVVPFITGENFPDNGGVIDVANGYAYFGVATSPAKVVKIRLSDFTRVDAITFNSGENTIVSAGIDTTNGYAYFGLYLTQAQVVKVRLSDFTRADVVTFISGEDQAATVIIDQTNSYGYVGTNVSPGKVVKLDLGRTSNTLGTAASQTINTNSTATMYGSVTGNTNDPTLNVDGNFVIDTRGVYTASNSGTFTVAGNWTNSGGNSAFTHSSGTVTFDTTATATLTGATTFNNFTSVIPGKTLQFQKHTTGAPVFTFAGTFLITGTSGGAGNLVNIYSDTSGTQWKAHFNSAQSSVTYANIRDGGCDAGTSNVTLDATSTSVSNNDTCWVFSTATFNQVNYRFGSGTANAISYSGAPSENSALTVTTSGQDFRLRLAINVGTATLAQNGKDFKLKFGEKPAGGCASASYSDVATGSGVIRYVDLGGRTDGEDITLVAGDPNFTGTEQYQDYEEGSVAVTFTNSVSAIASGENGVWDFSLENNSAVGGKRYCFQVVESDGTVLGTYTNYPEVIIDEELTFSLDATSKNFGVITPGAAPTDQTSTLTTQTNAALGYQITLWASQLLTKGAATIPNWTGTNASPTTFNSGAGFGYSTNDSNLAGGTADRFTNPAAKFAGFALSGSGDIVADNTGPAFSSENFTTTYRLGVGSSQDAGTYDTTLIYIVTSNY